MPCEITVTELAVALIVASLFCFALGIFCGWMGNQIHDIQRKLKNKKG